MFYLEQLQCVRFLFLFYIHYLNISLEKIIVKKNLDSKYVNTVYKTEKETEHTVTALGKTYHKNDIAPLTESQYGP